jgi:hypothetical protein
MSSILSAGSAKNRAEFPQRPGDEIEQGQREPGARRRNLGKETKKLIFTQLQ